MTYALEDLRMGIVELFADTAQLSSHFCSYVEREAFTFRRGGGMSRYRCEVCGSMSETHRCVVPDKVPPEGFSMWAAPALTQDQCERRRVEFLARYHRSKKEPLPEPFRGGRQCGVCGARAPQHRCVEPRLEEG